MTVHRRSYPPEARLVRSVARDGWPIRTYLQPPSGTPRGSILWLGGRGDIVEKYLETLDAWAKGGWDVTSFDWRGQGGSGRIGANRAVGHVHDFALWIDDLADFFKDWAERTPPPHIVMGHSMGGHLVLRALSERQIAPDRVVLIAPMLGFDTGFFPFPVVARAVRLLGWVTSDLRPAWKHNERPSPPSASRQAYLTHDPARYADEMWWKDRDPSLALGPPSWAWLAAAYRSIAALNKRGALEDIRVPILILCADADQLVSARAIRRAAARLRHAKLVVFGEDTAHEILREADDPRDRALAAIGDFLE